MFVIINSGVCCHYQIEGGVFTTREKADDFRKGLVNEYTTLEQLEITPVKVDPAVSDFTLDTLDRPRTAIWPPKK